MWKFFRSVFHGDHELYWTRTVIVWQNRITLEEICIEDGSIPDGWCKLAIQIESKCKLCDYISRRRHYL